MTGQLFFERRAGALWAIPALLLAAVLGGCNGDDNGPGNNGTTTQGPGGQEVAGVDSSVGPKPGPLAGDWLCFGEAVPPAAGTTAATWTCPGGTNAQGRVVYDCDPSAAVTGFQTRKVNGRWLTFGNQDLVSPSNQPPTPPSGYCVSSRMAVFTKNYAAALKDDLPWDVGYEVQSYPLAEPVLEKKIYIWMATTAVPDYIVNLAVDHANYLLEINRIGIKLLPEIKQNLTPTQLTKIGDWCGSEVWNQGPTVYQEKYLNIYYVPQQSHTKNGEHCTNNPGPGRSGVIYIDSFREYLHLLAHEIGHALTLEHPLGTPVRPYAVMSPGGCTWAKLTPTGSSQACDPVKDETTCKPGCNVVKTEFALGEAYRMNFDSTAFLNANLGSRDPALLVNCNAHIGSADCPELIVGTP